MSFDFSKLVKVGSKILLCKGKLIVPRTDSPEPIPTSTYEIFEGLYQPAPGNDMIFTAIMEKNTSDEIISAYLWYAIQPSMLEDVYYLDEAHAKIETFDKSGDIITFESSGIQYTYDTSTKTLNMKISSTDLTVEYKPEKTVKQTRIVEQFKLILQTENKIQSFEYLLGDWTELEGETNTYSCTLDTRNMRNGPFGGLSYSTNFGTFKIIGGEKLDVITNLTGLFGNCGNYLTAFENVAFNNVTSIDSAFASLSSITALPTINWNKIETANNAFNGCEHLTNFLPIYNTLNSNGVIHDSMTFANCGVATEAGIAELEQIPSSWGGRMLPEIAANTIRFKFYNPYADPTNLAQKTNPATYKSENVGTWTNYGSGIWDWTYAPEDNSWYAIFASRITSGYACDIIAFGDTSAITDMTGLFSNCYIMQMLAPEINMTNCMTARNMFLEDRQLSTFETRLINTEKLESTEAMFQDCTVLKTIPVFNTENVKTMNCMFRASGIKSAPAFDTSSCEDFMEMFYECRYLTSIESYNFDSAKTCNEMFAECSSLETVPEIKMTGKNPVNIGQMFDKCENLKTVADFVLTSVQQAYQLFKDCHYLVVAPKLTGLDENCTKCYGMFEKCYNLKTIPYLPLNKCTNDNPSLNTCPQLTNLNYVGYNNPNGLTLTALKLISMESIFNLIKNAVPQEASSNVRLTFNKTLENTWKNSEYYTEATKLLAEKNLNIDFMNP